MTYQINIRGDLRNPDKELIEKFAFKGYNTKAGYSEASLRVAAPRIRLRRHNY